MRLPFSLRARIGRPFAGLMAAALLPLAGCDESPAATPVPTQIQVSPGSVTLVGTGTEQLFAATVLDQSGTPIPGSTVTWSSSAPAVITIDPSSGLATTQGEGTAQVQASSSGVTGLASVSVLPQNADCVVDVSLAAGQSLVQDAVGASGCDLFLPSGSSGDRYRVGLVWPESNQNNVTVANVTLGVTGVGGVTGGLPSPSSGLALAREPLSIPGDVAQALRDALERDRLNTQAHVALREEERRMLPGMIEALREADGPWTLAAEAGLALAPSPARWLYDPAVDSSCEAGTPRVAKLVAENDIMAVYQDSIEAVSSPADQSAVQEMLDYYRDHGKPVVDGYFGGAPDIDGDGRLRVLIAPVVATKNAVAFVWSGDMFPKTSCAQSNEMDLVYMDIGLVNGITGTAPASSQQWQALGTITHEAKHVSSLYNGVKGALDGGSARGFHPSWMEEGTAEIAAEMSSRTAWEAAGGPARGSRVDEQDIRDSPGTFNADNYNVILRLARTVQYMSARPNGLLNDQVIGHPGNIYGAGWNFHRFLGDQYGNATTPGGDAGFFATQNAETSTPGVPGLEALTGRSYELLFLEYAEAVLGHSVGLGTRAVDFRTYDLLATDVLCGSDPNSVFNTLGSYPWPLTVTGTRGTCDEPEDAEESKSFATAAYDGKLGPSGIQILDLVSNGTGDGARVTVSLSTSVAAKWVVVRVE
jgi:hypothetical protein